MRLRQVLARQIYRGTLQRPAAVVTDAIIRANVYPERWSYDIMNVLFNTKHVSIKELTDIYEKISPGFNKPNVAFIHLPKTAGTSVRVAIGKALGVAPITSYNFSKDISPEHWKNVNFWPFFAGHLNFTYFPSTHVGLTFFREPRSRVLSSFRQTEKAINHGIGGQFPSSQNGVSVADTTHLLNFPHWLDAVSNRSTARYFFPGSEEEFATFATTASDAELEEKLSVGLLSINFAAWSHDYDAIETTLFTLLDSPVELKRLNTFNQDTNYQKVNLTKDNLDTLSKITKYDQLLIDVAVNMGLIPRLSSSEADAIFEASVNRLGFQLP